MYYKRVIRGGQQEEHRGTVVIFGDVNREGSVVADGDIIVWGRLRGEAHAGRSGDEGAFIMALEMAPTQLRIADKVAYGSKGPPSPFPEVACLGEDGNISILPAGPYTTSPEERAKGRPKKAASLTKASAAALITGAYISAFGLALFIAPVSVFSLLFDAREVTKGWIQVGGVLAMVIGTYYLGAAIGDRLRTGTRAVYMATVIARVLLFFAFCWLAITKAVQPKILVLAGVNLIGAVGMLSALQADTDRQGR